MAITIDGGGNVNAVVILAAFVLTALGTESVRLRAGVPVLLKTIAPEPTVPAGPVTNIPGIIPALGAASVTVLTVPGGLGLGGTFATANIGDKPAGTV
jgi:hypothetical protein